MSYLRSDQSKDTLMEPGKTVIQALWFVRLYTDPLLWNITLGK